MMILSLRANRPVRDYSQLDSNASRPLSTWLREEVCRQCTIVCDPDETDNGLGLLMSIA